ncbi:MAG TPA: carboxyl transferase domain-containing protein, partial [Ottowia sp.]|nr:carboxyl transferase domain-containing protein [Ottowia sp.]
MSTFQSGWNASSPQAVERRAFMLERIAQCRALEQRTAQQSAKAAERFAKRHQLLPRERVALLLDRGAPWLPLASLAGYLRDDPDPAKSVPGGGLIAGIGFIEGTRCMVVASDSGIDAGAIQPGGLDKMLRVQEMALAERLPFIHLV